MHGGYKLALMRRLQSPPVILHARSGCPSPGRCCEQLGREPGLVHHDHRLIRRNELTDGQRTALLLGMHGRCCQVGTLLTCLGGAREEVAGEGRAVSESWRGGQRGREGGEVVGGEEWIWDKTGGSLG